MALLKDHPRVCGEKFSVPSHTHSFSGSPPRVRGKEYRCMSSMALSRITPACAGKRVPGVVPVSINEDHPRVCGEKEKEPMEILGHLGSPPRVRGKAQERVECGFVLRITPACAGKSVIDHGDSPPYQDHPRVCGEKYYTPLSVDCQ